MRAFRARISAFAACLPLVLAASACGGIGSAALPASVSGTAIPDAAPASPAYPPMEDNGAALRFVHYGLEAGLSQSSGRALMQDNLGFLWIGTEDGLNRFDGYSFKIFRPDPNDARSLSGRDISSIIQGAGGAVWIGTDIGLNRYDPATGEFRHWLHDASDADSLVNNTIQAICQDPQGQEWVGTAQGLDEFDPARGKFTHISLPKGPSGDANTYSINALYEDGQGILSIGTNEGLIRYNTAEQKFQLYQHQVGDSTSISFNVVSSIVGAEDGALWIGTELGLNRFEPASAQFTRFLHSDTDPTSLIDNSVLTTYVDGSRQLWVGTRNGLDRLDPGRLHFVHYQNDPFDPASLSTNSIQSIYEDRGGVLWVGTNGGGMNAYDRAQDKFSYYHQANADPFSLSSNIIFPIVPAAAGKMWIGTYQTGLNLFDPRTGRSEHYRHDRAHADSLLSDRVLSLLDDGTHTLWIGTDQGIDRLNPGSPVFLHYVSDPEDPTSVPYGRVLKIFQDRDSVYWVGTAHGLRRFDPATGRFVRINAGSGIAAHLTDGAIRAIFQDRSGFLWFGTETYGAFRFNAVSGELQQYQHDPNSKGSLSNNAVMDIFEDSQGRLWVATFGGGLNRYIPEEDAFAHYLEADGLPNDAVYGILEDRGGHLWLSTNLGLSKFDPSAGSFENFTVRDGLQSNEFDFAAFAQDAAGRMYFGGVNGLTVFDPLAVSRSPYIPPVSITSMTTPDGKPIDLAQTAETLRELKLAYPRNGFDFSFAALSFAQPQQNRYRYILEGFDKSWHTTGSDHQGSYTNLPGGTYTLRVAGSNGVGSWNEAGTAIKITVIPPLWQTPLFQASSALSLIVVGAIAYRRRVRSIQAQQVRLEEIIQDRTQALKKQNLDLEALYSADDKMLRVITLDQVLQTLVDVAVDILQASKSAVFTQTQAHGDFYVRVSRGFNPETISSLRVAEAERTLVTEAARGESVIIGDTSSDRAWRQQPGRMIERMSAENVHSSMWIPIRVENMVLGVFCICSSQPGAFNEDRQRLFASLGRRAALAIENNRLFEKTKHMAILEERYRLAQDLHDSAKQKAFAALAQLGAARKLANHGHDHAGEHLIEAENIVTGVIHDLTFLIRELYPKDLKEKGFAASLRDFATEWESRCGIRLNLEIVGERSLPLDMEQALYRIVQEGLSNIARHSQATQADAHIMYEQTEVEIQILDNGIGFDPHKMGDGLGLRLIRERTESIGGQLNVQSQEAGGTRLTIHAPIQNGR